VDTDRPTDVPTTGPVAPRWTKRKKKKGGKRRVDPSVTSLMEGGEEEREKFSSGAGKLIFQGDLRSLGCNPKGEERENQQKRKKGRSRLGQKAAPKEWI